MATIDDVTEVLKNKVLMLTIVKGLQDYLSCKIKFSKDKKRAWLGQPHLINNMEKKFDKLVQDVYSHKSPGPPKFLIVRPMVKSKTISMEDQQDYWLDIGMLLYLIRHLHPILFNMTMKLLKANNGANSVAYKELDTKNLRLEIKPMRNSNKPLEIICFRDSNYAVDLVSRKSISGFTIYVLGVLVF